MRTPSPLEVVTSASENGMFEVAIPELHKSGSSIMAVRSLADQRRWLRHSDSHSGEPRQRP